MSRAEKIDLTVKVILFAIGAVLIGLPWYEFFGRGVAIGFHIATAAAWFFFIFVVGDTAVEVLIPFLIGVLMCSILLPSMRRAREQRERDATSHGRQVQPR